MNADDPSARVRSLRPAILLILAVTVVRLVFLWGSPYELSADEAQYWDWSRNLELSYHTKGPGAAWTIAASTALLGTSEFGVRAPAVLGGAVMMLALALLARRMAPPSEGGQAALMAVVACLCIPAYHAAAMLMTIDGPMLACWAVAALAAWGMHENAGGADAPSPSEPRGGARARGLGTLLAWGVLSGAAIGVGFLFKYTILLGAVGMLAFLLLTRRGRVRSILPALAAAALVFVVCISPVLIWNAQRGWPTLAHLLGHLGLAGSDLPASSKTTRAYTPMWTLEYLGVLIGLAGPVVVCMVLAVREGMKHRTPTVREGLVSTSRQSEVKQKEKPLPHGRGAVRAGALLGVCGALPVLLTYLVVSFFTDVEGNWPIGAWVALIPITGVAAARVMREHAERVRAWLALPLKSRPRAGVFRKKPESAFQIAWHWGIGFGVVAWAGMMLLLPISKLPWVGALVPVHRVSGARELAGAVDAERARLEMQTGTPAIVIGARYTHTALLAFYCEGRPAVFSAASRLGDRRSAYDDFVSTDLTDPALIGRPAVLVDSGDVPRPERWARAVRFDVGPVEAIGGAGGASRRVPRYIIYTARGYAGVAESRALPPVGPSR
ncbi:MAG: ArnT family glycosyltransferase [Phycisphaerales bacterium]